MKNETSKNAISSPAKPEKKSSKGLSMKVPSFFSSKKSSTAISTKSKALERNEEEKEDE